jgi:NAD(P)-dependent dehydrogenase (short-subunit alcohol dehydrogenase family)
MSTIVITGISRGIGKAVAEMFLEKGWQVIGGSKSGTKPFEHTRLLTVPVDLTDETSIASFVAFVEKNGTDIKVLVNNAGILIDNGQELSMDSLRKTLEVNLFGLISLTEKLVPVISKGGHIINLSSGLGSIERTNSGHYPSYRISKASVNMYTRVLAGRLAGLGITVSSIDPGWVKTDMGGAGASRNPSEPAQEIYDLATSQNQTGYFWHKGKKQAW